jgi:hypothetical protein
MGFINQLIPVGWVPPCVGLFLGIHIGGVKSDPLMLVFSDKGGGMFARRFACLVCYMDRIVS